MNASPLSLRQAAPALIFGFALTFGSSAGQTYFIGLFAGALRGELHLSHGAFGAIYTAATLASAATLLWLGRLADRFKLRHLGVAAVVGLAAAALAMASVRSGAGLVVALFGLRLFGQGLLSHLALTAMGRWFGAGRGRALAIATLGFPVGEAVLPATVAIALLQFDWRVIWAGTALTLLLLLAPLVGWVGSRLTRAGLDRTVHHGHGAAAPANGSWTRPEVLRDPRFYALLPAILAPPFIITGLFFHQVALVETKGWSLVGFAACYPLYAGGAALAALAGGDLVDRYGAVRLLPIYLLPLAAGLGLVAVADAPISAALFMTLLGCTSGSATVVLGALWPELYGTAHLGAIRALAVTLMVFATALSPGILGWLIDAGISLPVQSGGLALYTTLCAALLALRSHTLAAARMPPRTT